MEFPTNELFEQNKETTQQIIKWREVPVDVIYHAISAYSVDVVHLIILLERQCMLI